LYGPLNVVSRRVRRGSNLDFNATATTRRDDEMPARGPGRQRRSGGSFNYAGAGCSEARGHSAVLAVPAKCVVGRRRRLRRTLPICGNLNA